MNSEYAVINSYAQGYAQAVDDVGVTCGTWCWERRAGSGLLSLLDPVRQLSDLVVGRALLRQLGGDLLARMHDRGVVASAEFLSDPRQ